MVAVAFTESAWPTIAVRKVIAADMFAEFLRKVHERTSDPTSAPIAQTQKRNNTTLSP